MTLDGFILEHENDDTSALLLARHRFPDIDIDLAVTTIECRRRLRRKVPSWYAVPSLRFPSRLAAEQCSSEETALVKARVAHSIASGSSRLQTAFLHSSECDGLQNGEPSIKKAVFMDSPSVLGDPSTNKAVFMDRSMKIADLTGGMGVDSWAFSRVFREVLYNEMQPALAEATQENLGKLGVTNVRFSSRQLVPGNLKEILGGFRPDLIFLDPARRAGDGRKVFRLTDCQPDVLTLLPELMDACPDLLLKLSPMADITQLSRELPGLRAVTVVGAGGECKELLLHIRRDYNGPYALTVMENGATLSFDADDRGGLGETLAQANRLVATLFRANTSASAAPSQRLLFEPGKALAKAGVFRQLASRFGLAQADSSTHLYFAESIPEALLPFGKIFQIEEVLPLGNETYRSLRKRIPAAEITARNLPLTSDALRRKLGIASGGTKHLFGLRTPSGNLLLVTTPL